MSLVQRLKVSLEKKMTSFADFLQRAARSLKPVKVGNLSKNSPKSMPAELRMSWPFLGLPAGPGILPVKDDELILLSSVIDPVYVKCSATSR